MDAYFSKDGRMQKDIKAGVRESENEVLSVTSSSEDIAIEINDGCQGTLVFNYALQQNGEKLIKNLDKQVKPKVNTTPENDFIYRDIENKLKESMGTKVIIHNKDNNKGKIEIEYYSQDDFERIVDILKK